MIEALLKGFVTEEWVEQLDFSGLTRDNVEHTTDDLRSRNDDVIWRIYVNNLPIYIVCLLEFQSTTEKFMAARILTYTGLIYQDLIAENNSLIKNQGKLPPIFPLVFYTGSTPWNARVRFRDCLLDNIPGVLGKYQAKDDNLVIPLIQLEKVGIAPEAIPIISRLTSLLKGSEFDSLRRAYLVYIEKALKFDVISPEFKITELQEVNTMLAEKFEQWQQSCKQEGLKQGIEQGRQKLIYVLERLLKNHCLILSKERKASLSCASLEEIQKCIDVVLNNELIEV